MRILILTANILVISVFNARGDGTFSGTGTLLFSNHRAPTRLFSIDGPLAGADIWAQMLVGENPDSLAPVDMPRFHNRNGIVNGGTVRVTGFPCLSYAYVQMVAWDGTLWGPDLANVPHDQLGMTDVVLYQLSCPLYPAFPPHFTQPAIVPIPEPSVLALGVVAGALLLGSVRRFQLSVGRERLSRMDRESRLRRPLPAPRTRSLIADLPTYTMVQLFS